jgi:hypothetical protein
MTTPSDRTTTFRRRFGALCLVGATVLFTAAELLYPAEGDDPAHELGVDAAHHGQLLAAIGCTLVAGILFFPGFFALMNPVRGRGTVLTHLGGGLALLGNALSGLVVVGLDFVLYEASAPGVDRSALVPFIEHATKDPVGVPLLLGHYLFALGVVLLAVGLCRARVGYRWAAVALGLAPLIDAVLGTVGLDSSEAGEVVPSLLSDGALLAGAVGLAWWLWTTSNAAFDGRPVRTPAQEPVPVAA